VNILRDMLARRWIRRRIAKRILACFDGIDLNRHSFVADGRTLRTQSGEERFYQAGEIDRAIDRINELMKELRA
jgi:hypothetical protein